MKIIKRFGPPGTGKTTSLLTTMEECLSAGVKPWKFGFISFTKKAANEARNRAMERFNLAEKHLPYFRTIHSLVFRQLGLQRDSVIQWRHYRELGDKLGIQFQGRSTIEDGNLYGMGIGDRIMFMESLARVKKEPLQKVWADANETEIEWEQIDLYARSLLAYKKNLSLVDYTNMLEMFVAQGEKLAPQLDVLCIDEAQDCSPIQWDVLRILMAKTPVVYVVGDDDQAIYNWAGADVNQFLGLDGEVEVLDQSYRVPAAIHKAANGISSAIKRRQSKTWKPKAGSAGTIAWHNNPEDVDMSAGTWLLLARNGYMLQELEEMCLYQGLSFRSVGKSPLDAPSLKAIISWEKWRRGERIAKGDAENVTKFMPDEALPAAARAKLRAAKDKPLTLADARGLGVRIAAEPAIWHETLTKIPAEEREYFIAARRRGETLTKTPRINISTIHSAKGGEAENVMLLTDVSNRSYEQMLNNPDDERRVLYVALTRAMENMHLIQPRTPMHFELREDL